MQQQQRFEPRPGPRLRLALGLCAGLAAQGALAASARAQLDLPERPASEPAEPAPVTLERKGESLKARVLGETQSRSPLALPDGAAAASSAKPQDAPAPALAPAPAPTLESLGSQVAFIFGELERVEGLADPLIDAAVASLGRLGPDGLMAARMHLASGEPATVLTCAFVLMGFGSDADWPLVAERLHASLPKGEAGAIIEAVVAFDPVRGSPAFVASLLDHPQTNVRATAERLLREVDDAELLPLLAAALASERADTRLRALGRAATIDHPARLEILLDALGDPSARVAREAVLHLAGLPPEPTVDRLLRRAFQSRWILRDSAYALIAIMEREDASIEALLDESHVEALAVGLESTDAFIAGTSAAALAGIGFRSAELSAPWLESAVPSELLRAVSGREFHSDYAALQDVAVRRLALITGESLGGDGPAWLAWWQGAHAGFQPRRAWIAATPADAGRLLVRVSETGPAPSGLRLVGPELAAPEVAPAPSAGEELVYLSAPQARDLFARIEADGVLGPERLPGSRGPAGAPAQSLEVAIGDRVKTFRFAGQGEPWFERLCEAARALARANRWQRYPDPGLYASSYELWRAEATWWDDPHGAVERARREVDMLFAWLPAQEPEARAAALADLRELYATPGVPRVSDFHDLRALMNAEPSMGPRAAGWIELAERAARASGAEAAGAEPSALASDLFESVLAKFGASARAELGTLLARAGPARVHSAVLDSRPFLRALAAAELARAAGEAELALLEKLLSDPLEEVEIAAIEALGRERVAGLEDELALRARVAGPSVRRAACIALGRIGGPAAFDTLIANLGDASLAVRAAAARGLAELGDPACAPMLVDLLGAPEGSELYAAACAGLLQMGPAAHDALLRAMHDPAHLAHRTAALIVAREALPEAAAALLRLLTEQPDDAEVRRELAVLTAVDFSAALDPAAAWWTWWDGVRHDDAFAWFQAGLLREGIAAPPAEDFAGPGTRAARQALWSALDSEQECIAERARRELARRMGRELGPLPARGLARDAWRGELAEELARTALADGER